jgi:uncharacterized protein (TIGR03382 family)
MLAYSDPPGIMSYYFARERGTVTYLSKSIAILALSTAAFAAPIITYSSAAITCTGSFNALFPCSNINDNQVNDFDGTPSTRPYWLGRQRTALATITIDLGSDFTLSQLDLYNTSNRQYEDRATLDFRVWISSTPVTPTIGAGDTFGTLILDSTLTNFTGDPNPVQSFTTFLGNPSGRYLTFRADSSDTQGSGLSELDVFGTPEPGTTVLMAAGVFALAVLGRRRRA